MHGKPASIPIVLFLLLGILMPVLAAQPIKAETHIVKESSVALARHITVPFYYQEEDYYCGPACLQMVFNYYGENISQQEIAAVARTIGEPAYSTFTDELRRAGHFSNISTSMGDELPHNVTGYTLRKLGYASSESQGMNLTTLEAYIDQGRPLILAMWYSYHHVSTHYRVVTGYNQTHVFLHDPWNKPLWGGAYGGPDLAFNNSEFLDLWSYLDNWALYVSPWAVDINAPAHVTPGTPFLLESTIVYPQPLPEAFSVYPASFCNASIDLPANLSLVQGEFRKKTVGTGFLDAGSYANVSWMLVASSPPEGTLNITVEGMVSGSVSAHYNYTAYDYNDRIGVTASFVIRLGEAIDAVSIANVTTFKKTVVGQGYPINVTVSTENHSTEDFDVAVDATTTAIGTETVNNTPNGTPTTLTFVWNTSAIVYGNYTISAFAWPVPGEVNLTDNVFVDGMVLVTIPGDINGDLRVTVQDLVLLANAYASHPGDARWNPNADIDGNGVVGLSDLVILAIHYGQHFL